MARVLLTIRAMLKHTLVLVPALLVVTLFAGCGGSEPPPPQKESRSALDGLCPMGQSWQCDDQNVCGCADDPNANPDPGGGTCTKPSCAQGEG
jgi:hypothetical protein